MKGYFKTVIFAVLLSLCAGQALFAAEDRTAPDFKLKDMGYNPVSLSSYLEKGPVLVFFWTSWCPYCRKEIKAITQKSAELSGSGVSVLMVNVGESRKDVASFLEGYDLTYPVLLDVDSIAATDFAIRGVPAYILVNKKGDIVFNGNSFPSDYIELIAK